MFSLESVFAGERLRLAVGFLTSVDNATDQDDLIARLVFDGESEGSVGLNLSLGSLLTVFGIFLTVNRFLLVLFSVVLTASLVLILDLVDLFLDLVDRRTRIGRADSLLGDLDGGLMNQFVQMQVLSFSLLLLLLVLLANTREIGLIAIEGVANALFQQGLLGIQFGANLDLGQLYAGVLFTLIANVQQLFQLLSILDLLLLDSSQTVLLFGHDHVDGELLTLSRDTDNLQLLVFVVVEFALALDGLALFRLLASQREESSGFGDLLLTELTSPFGLHLESADRHHFRVIRDGVLGNDVLDLFGTF